MRFPLPRPKSVKAARSLHVLATFATCTKTAARVALTAGFAACAFAGPAAPKQPLLTLGVIAPPAEAAAPSIVRGVQLAIEDANAAGEGPVHLELRSEAGQWGTVGNDAVVLVCQRHADGLIGPPDGADAHLMLQVSGRTRVPMANLCSDRSVTGAGVPWAVQVVPRNDRQAAVLFAHEPLARRWWAVVPSGRAGRSVGADLASAAASAGVTLERMLAVSRPDEGAVPAIVAAHPDGVLLWVGAANAGTLAGALRSAGYAGVLAGPCTLDAPAFLAAAGSAARGVRVVRIRADRSDDRRGAFVGAYQARYHSRPDFTAAASYDAARVLLDILRTGDRGDAFRRMPPAHARSGATGPMHFDSAGDRTDALEVGGGDPETDD